QHAPVSIVGALTINEWNGNRTVQLVAEDIQISERQLFDFRGRKDRLDLNIYTSFYEKTCIITSDEEVTYEGDDIQFVSYKTGPPTTDEVDLLVITELPDELNDLEKIIEKTEPNNILVSYEVEHSVYLEATPTRDDFKWLYGF